MCWSLWSETESFGPKQVFAADVWAHRLERKDKVRWGNCSDKEKKQ